MSTGGRAMFSTPRLPIQLLLKHESTIVFFFLSNGPTPGASVSLMRGFKVRSNIRTCPGHQAAGTFGTLPSLSRATLRQRRCTINQEFACWCRRTYLVFMPSPIFEFRCAVHGSPSVIYHPTENLRIRSACSRLCYTEPSLLLGFFLFHSKRKLGISCKMFTVSVKAQITHWNSSCSSCVAARYSNKSDEIPTSSSAWNLKHKHISDWGEEKAKFNLILKIN